MDLKTLESLGIVDAPAPGGVGFPYDGGQLWSKFRAERSKNLYLMVLIFIVRGLRLRTVGVSTQDILA